MEIKKARGFKLTPQRLAILEFLDDNVNHPSAEDVYIHVSKKFPTMSLATVYNTLETLRKKGEIAELTIDPNKKRFDPDTDTHHHLICTVCRRILDIRVDYRIDLPERVRGGYEVTGSHIEFYGICPLCRKKDRTKVKN